jgi:chorismate mutase / prephenate dehydratase
VADGAAVASFVCVTDPKREADDLRTEIGAIDLQLLAALDHRARAARRLGELRRDQAPSLPITDQAAVRALVARSSGDMPAEALRDLFREIFAVCFALELPLKVAYVSIQGGIGHATARGRFGHASTLVAADTAAAAIDEVSRRRAEFALVPFETSLDGPVQSTILALLATDLRIT